MNISPKNLTSAPINWALLPKNLQSEKGNLELYQEFYDEEPSIKENVDKLIDVIKKTHTSTKKPIAKKAKGVRQLPTKKPAAKLPVRKKRTTTKPTPKRRIKTKAKPKPKPKVVKEKVPVTVRKLSLELQVIKSFALMDGKSRKVASIKNFLKKAEMAKNNTNVAAHKVLLTEIVKKMKAGLKSLSQNVDTISKVTVNADFLQKCKAAVKNAKPRIQVQYLSGIKRKK